ncbi:MAG: peptidoglycan-associated lipoprotein Pal [Cypionkella sp.]|uniref:peptidoglycan-associated lipoprotein Pal n=1 Tax=Cypionkella sp. TaxID=2811411 RepID=UPI002AB9C46A|nr:peptidoglycan-associated lipoprotein Pal [Cypionkella sp.]MDZ4311324.1 peptidoglycan-associated lipoprotein Pal [Cypionkella sp.]MDZ4393656.1 peptidoglycan-associated lipoprotein Pal [Cypionkella sp.]
MTLLPKALLLVAALGLAACNNPDRYKGADGAGGMNNGAGTGGINTNGLGDPSNPRSIAYFNQSVGDRVLFPVDQSTLTPEARGVLAGQASWLATNGDYAIIIEGHADEKGTREYNLALGARRAASVQDFLISQGVAPSRMRTISYGKERPIEVCSDEGCYSKNRRAVTVLSMGAGA